MKISNQDDTFFMKYAIRLAARNLGLTGENPSVGCVLVSNGKIISYGITGIGGSPHAEFEAINKIKNIPSKTTAYITLEPCSHIGKNPSCVHLLIKNRISRVVIATKDPNPNNNGEGVKILKNEGIDVKEGIEECLAKENIFGFDKRIRGLYPELNIKVASFKNGITIPDDESPWITNALSRSYGHILRSNHDAIIVGVNTVKIDNPNLDCRLQGMFDRSPTKIIIDTNLTTPLNSSLVKNAKKNRLIIYTKPLFNNEINNYKEKGVEVIGVELNDNGQINLKSVLSNLRSKGFNRILVEGGSELSSSFLEDNFVNLVYWFTSDRDKTNYVKMTKGDKSLNKLIRRPKFKIKDSINLKNDNLKIIKSI